MNSFQYAGKSWAIPAVALTEINDELYDFLPVYEVKGGWNDGVALKQLAATGCSLADALQIASVKVKTLDGKLLQRKVDYDFTDKWGVIGRVVGGAFGEKTPVTISYAYLPLRLDSLLETAGGELEYRTGKYYSFCPQLPAIHAGEKRLVNVYNDALGYEILPVLQPTLQYVSAAGEQQYIARTMDKLKHGQPLKILAWGDSVTEGVYLTDKRDRWQIQFVEKLQQRYPDAKIELVSNGWGGKTVGAFLAEPPGSIHNFVETVLAVKPDLVISEFVNDAGLPPKDWPVNFGAVLKEFRKHGMEWIILTPHYVRPDWMGLTRQSGEEISDDPRPYVKYLRQFANDEHIALADAARYYGQLWKLGIPYNTLMTNNINHPDRAGMAIFANALMAIFE